MGARTLRTARYSDEARARLGRAVAKAREAAGYKYRTDFARAAGIRSLRSLDMLEAGEPGVGQSILFAVARALPGWDEDTPRVILEGGPIPPVATAEPREQVREQQPAAQAAPPDLLDKINYLRRKLGKEDFHLMWDVFTEINESNARFEEAEAAKARAEHEEVRPTDNPARVAG